MCSLHVESLSGALAEGGELPGVVVLEVSRGGQRDVGDEGLPVVVRGVLGGVLGVLQGRASCCGAAGGFAVGRPHARRCGCGGRQ